MEESSEVPHLITSGNNFSNTNVQQVLTGNLNGPLYVIGNPNEVFVTQPGTRAIAPRSAIIDTTATVATNTRKVNVSLICFFFLL